MKLKGLNPDIVLAKLLDNQIQVQIADDKFRKVRAYAHASQPDTGVGDEFVDIIHNGNIFGQSEQGGMYRGNIALTLYCKLNPNTTAKRERISSMIEQAVALVDGRSSRGFFYKLDRASVITPITADRSTGYGYTVLNVTWRTTDEYHNAN